MSAAKHSPRWERTPCWPDLGKHSSTDGGGSPGLKSGDFCSSPATSFVMLCYLGECLCVCLCVYEADLCDVKHPVGSNIARGKQT